MFVLKPTELARLIKDGCGVSVVNGEISVILHSEPHRAIDYNAEKLINDIALITGVLVLKYEGRSVGEYQQASGKRAGGITLTFIAVGLGELFYAIFNVNTRRLRTTKTGRKGQPLPLGKFTVGGRAALPDLWRRLGLTNPRSPSDWPDCVGPRGPLSRLYLTAEILNGERLNKSTINLLNIEATAIAQCLDNFMDGVNSPLTSRQFVVSPPLLDPVKGVPTAQCSCSLQPVPAAGCSDCGKTVKGNAVNGGPYPLPLRPVSDDAPVVEVQSQPVKKPPQEQTIDEWYAEYDAAGGAPRPTFLLDQ